MKYPKDISGMKFGRLTVIERATDFVSKRGNKSSAYLCKCECGEYIVERASCKMMNWKLRDTAEEPIQYKDEDESILRCPSCDKNV